MPVTNFLRILFITSICTCLAVWSCKTHTKTTASSTKDETPPAWIAMMDSPGVNYYKAVEAFEKYWEHREKPTEDDGEGKDLFGKDKTKEEKEKEEKRPIQYVYEYKQFLNWQQRNKNLVKQDGTIMTSEEVLEQWKKSRSDTLIR